MADELHPTDPLPPSSLPPRRSGSGSILLALVLAFGLGAGAVGYAGWKGVLPFPWAAQAPVRATQTAVPASPVRNPSSEATLLSEQTTLEGRMAALEQRLDALNTEAEEASGHASRAEALLVSFAARRALDRGAPLGYLEDQLRLRFGNAQPNAVATIIDAAKTPVTLDQLLAGLDSLSPALTQAPQQTGAWERVRNELASLFVIRRETAPSPAPQTQLAHARLLLETGRVEDAITEIRRLPGASDATDWFAAARRYDAARRALDVLESAAMLDTRSQPGNAIAGEAAPLPMAAAD